ncbi:hypothetical protein PC120_g20425 [Phytophthora cactorum]|nr:hypothetical protein PC120_g20425 [Phytophthora cactorum]
MKNAEFVNLLYKNATATEGTCSFCNRVVKQKKQAGYKNLITHLQDFHNGYETVAEECVKNNCEPLSSMFVHKDAADTYGWTKLVALKTFPFTHVDDPIIRYAIRYKAMDRATLLKRMVALVGVVDTNSAEKLAGEKFALVFDGLTDSAEHAIAFFAATKQGLRFLAFSPFQDESSMTAAEHIDFLDMVLSQYMYGLVGWTKVQVHRYEVDPRNFAHWLISAGLPYNTTASDDFKLLIQMMTGDAKATILAASTFRDLLEAIFVKFCMMTASLLQRELQAAHGPFLKLHHDGWSRGNGNVSEMGTSASLTCHDTIVRSLCFSRLEMLVMYLPM